MGEPLTILIAARDEAERIGTTIEELRRRFPDAELIVADDGSRDGTAAVAEAGGALAMLLVLADPDAAGDFGVRDTADKILPPIEPLPATSG